LRAESLRIAVACVLLFVFNVALVLIPWLLDGAVEALGHEDPDEVTRYAAWIVATAAAAAMVRIWSRRLLIVAARKVEHAVRCNFYRRALDLSAAFYARNGIADVVSRLTNGLDAIFPAIAAGLLNAVNALCIYSLVGYRLFSLSWSLAAIALLPFPLVFIAIRRLSARLLTLERRSQERLGLLSSEIFETFSSVAFVKGHSLEGLRSDRFDTAQRDYLDGVMASQRIQSLLMPLLSLGMSVATLLALGLGAREVIQARPGALTLPRFVEFSALLALIAWPTAALGIVLAQLQRARAAWGRMRSLFIAGDDLPPARGRTLTSITGQIQARGLATRSPHRGTLIDISFDIEPGEHIAVVGRTGSGKSTLAELLAGLARVDGGNLLLDGHDMHELDSIELRKAVAYAPQESFLFSMSIAENIAMGLRGPVPDAEACASDPRVAAAAQAAGLERDLVDLPLGIRTQAGEQGARLSGGQRQRVALARSLVADAAVLVLDDALSAIDADTEQTILANVRRLRAGRTTIAFGHRTATARAADRILVLAAGRLVESGRHDELLACGGHYARILRGESVDRAAGARDRTNASMP
jgi:ATP-binding cassette subfamily B protein